MIVNCDVADACVFVLPSNRHLAESCRPLKHLGGRLLCGVVQDHDDEVVKGIAPVKIKLRGFVLILTVPPVLV